MFECAKYFKKLCFKRGFTIIEVLIVIIIAAMLTGIALPPYIEWRKSVQYHASARSILLVLREARARAIASNYEHRVEFENANRRFRITRGNRASSSSDWSTVVSSWYVLPQEVYMHANVTKIHLNPMGTANAGTVAIQDENGQIKCQVRILSTGRARIL